MGQNVLLDLYPSGIMIQVPFMAAWDWRPFLVLQLYVTVWSEKFS